MVTELFKGVTLLEYMNLHYGSMTELDCLNILYLLLTKLAYIEKLEIVHRDLKPSNIIVNDVDKKMTVSIVDFGLCCKTKYSLKSGTMKKKLVVGSGGYMCPEILRGLSYNTTADVFSVGCVYHLLLFGNHAFVKENYEETIKCNKECDYNNI